MADETNFSRNISMRGTKAQVEAFTGTFEESALAYATDTGQIGIWTNGAWAWSGGQYRQFAYEVSGGAINFMVDEEGNPLFMLLDME